MLSMGFDASWVDLIMQCISSVSYAVKLNDAICEPFKTNRGLRQDDPISPYLFLICIEGFSMLLRKAKREGVLKGVNVCQGSP